MRTGENIKLSVENDVERREKEERVGGSRAGQE